MTESAEVLIEKAKGYFELSMFAESWETVETLPSSRKTDTLVLDLRLRILTSLSQWELGQQLAGLLIYAGDSERRTVARFHHAHARALWQSGEFRAARLHFRRAVEAQLDVRKEFDDDDLEALCKD